MYKGRSKNKLIILSLICCNLLGAKLSFGQNIKLNANTLHPVQVSMSLEKLDGRDVVRVRKDPSVIEVDQPTFVRINGISFKNGVIKVKVLSRLLKNAPELARGFIGIAFRINELNSKFECIYIRPTNGRAEDQIRRNHSIQYFSYPDYPYTRLRKESPEQYETHADMGLNEWTQLRIEVKDQRATLFLNHNKYATLVVNDLKHGADTSGAIGLFVDVGTEGFFRDLQILPDN